MSADLPLPILILFTGALAGAVLIGMFLSRALRRNRQKKRMRRGKIAESKATVLLANRGYNILAEQPRFNAEISIDGELETFTIIPDLIVERHGIRYVAEVKSGCFGGQTLAPAARRQMLEYLLLTGCDSVLWVNPDNGTMREVQFPDRQPAHPRKRWLVPLLLIILAASLIYFLLDNQYF